MTIRITAVGALILLLSQTTLDASPIAYMRSTVGLPWGLSGNETQMDAVFGAGNWDDLRYETAVVGTLFSASTDFIFMEGGDHNANELEAFLTSNMTAIDNWVNAGGRLLVNAAPNEDNGMDFGFGITLSYPKIGHQGHAVNGSHPIMNGPATPVGTDWVGSSFSHAVTADGGGFSSIIVDENGFTSLGEKSVGSGHVVAGGLTLPFFTSHPLWTPQPEVSNLHYNIIAYAAGVPEPSTIALAALGFFALAAFGWRRNR